MCGGRGTEGDGHGTWDMGMADVKDSKCSENNEEFFTRLGQSEQRGKGMRTRVCIGIHFIHCKFRSMIITLDSQRRFMELTA